MLQAEGAARVQALRQDHARSTLGRVRSPVWLERSGCGATSLRGAVVSDFVGSSVGSAFSPERPGSTAQCRAEK